MSTGLDIERENHSIRAMRALFADAIL